MDSRVDEALALLAEEAREAWLPVVHHTIQCVRVGGRVTSTHADPVAILQERVAVLSSGTLLEVAEVVSAALAARSIYMRAAGALRGHWCAECGRPHEGTHQRGGVDICEACYHSNVVV